MHRNASTAVQMLWCGGPLSRLERLCLRSFAALGYGVHLYSYHLRASEVPAGVQLMEARAVLPESAVFVYGAAAGKGAGSYAAFSDLFRYKLLLDRGGWWVDTDVVCVRELPICESLVAQERTPEGGVTAASCVLRLPAGSGVARYCYDAASAASPSELHWGQIGPTLVQHGVERFGMQESLAPPHWFCPIDWFQANALVEGMFEVPDDTIAVHLWNEIWRQNGVDKNSAMPADCLYEHLMSRYGIN